MSLVAWGSGGASINSVNSVYPIELKVEIPSAQMAAWMDDRQSRENTHQDIAQRLDKLAMCATTQGGRRCEVRLMTWHRQLGHLMFKTAVELSTSGVYRMTITDLPVKLPGLDLCVACVAGKSTHLPHKEGRERATEYLERVHINIAGPGPVASAGGWIYVYVVVGDHTRAVYTRLLQSKSEAVEAFRAFEGVAENGSGKKVHEVLMDNAWELSIGEVRRLCEANGIKLNTTVPYNPVSNSVAERTIAVLTNAV